MEMVTFVSVFLQLSLSGTCEEALEKETEKTVAEGNHNIHDCNMNIRHVCANTQSRMSAPFSTSASDKPQHRFSSPYGITVCYVH